MDMDGSGCGQSLFALDRPGNHRTSESRTQEEVLTQRQEEATMCGTDGGCLGALIFALAPPPLLSSLLLREVGGDRKSVV